MPSTSISHPFSARTLTEVLRGRAEASPQRTAFHFLQEDGGVQASWDYASLDERARAIAARLAADSRPGDRALLLYPPGLDFVAALFACAYAGVVAVPAYPPRNKGHLPRLLAIIKDASPSLSLTNAKTLAGMRLDVESSPEFSALRWVATDEVASGLAAEWRAAGQDGDSLALLQYTSGSTGTPRGVRVSHGNILYDSLYIQRSFRLHPASVSACWLPAFHDMGLIDGVIQPVYGGFLGVLLSPASFIQKPLRWLEAISRHRATHAGGPNFGYDLCTQKIAPEQRIDLDLSCWESAYNGAEPVRAHTLRAFAGAFQSCGFRPQALYPCYGMAEATLMVTGCEIDREPVTFRVDKGGLEAGRIEDPASAGDKSVELVSSGRAILQTRIGIADPETGQPAGPDRVGEVWVAGPAVCQGYWERADETEKAFGGRLPGEPGTRWLRTGDLGFIREGELFITGRLKDLIIIRGRNHYPQDIEWTAEKAAPGLRAGGAIAFSAEAGGEERLVVVQELERLALKNPDVPALGRAIAEALAREHEVQIHAVVLIKTGTLPKTSSGKLQRRGCRARWSAGELETVGVWLNPVFIPAEVRAPAVIGAAAPVADIRKWLLDKIAARLNCPPAEIDPAAAFSRHGLDSLSIVALSGELESWLGRAVPPTALYDHPSVEALSRHLGGKAEEAPAPRRNPERADEAIAVIGLGCRFPGGADSPEEFWRLLTEGVDAVTEVPADRWSAAAFHDPDPDQPGKIVSRCGGFLRQVDRFDAEFFSISPREAAEMDPQQRLLLEVAWESLEHAAVPADSLAGVEAGVFVGLSTHDYADLQLRPDRAECLGGYAATGSSFSAAAGRISYLLGLRGPAMAIDTACSSSLVAVHLACQSLRAGECHLALAGGVNVILSPVLGANFSRARMMAPDGRCKAFDAAADGYVRSEGCGMVVLKRLSEAVAAGDRILAVIRGSAVNQDGRSNGLTAPHGPAQEAVIGKALAQSGLVAADIGYVEAHGTGTALGDPIELQALHAALGADRDRGRPLLVGSVKTNLGHLEAAAGVASLIKAVLAVREGCIPPSLHFHRPNPLFPWEQRPLAVADRLTPWAGTRRAGVSSFGFTGTNAHVIVEQPPESPRREGLERPWHLLPLSARSDAALSALAGAHRAALEKRADLTAAEACFTASVGRAHFDHRMGVVGRDAAELRAELERATPDRAAPGPAGIAFLFTGQGSQYAGMAQGLFRFEPEFRRAFDRCERAFIQLRGESLRALIEAGAAGGERLGETSLTQPALFAVAYALTELWQSWGVRPGAVLGHSVGEYAAACAAGVFSVEDGLRLTAERGRLMQALPAGGGMRAVFAPEAIVREALAGRRDLALAALNGPEEAVVSGPLTALENFAAFLVRQNIESRPLVVSHAFHSPAMEPMLGEFERILAEVLFEPARLPVVSNVSGALGTADFTRPAYWREHVLAPVRFHDGMRALAQAGFRHFLEIGPKPILSALARKGWSGTEACWLPSLRENGDDHRVMLSSLAELYRRGFAIDWAGFHRPAPQRKVTLPTMRFQRERHWIEAAMAPTPRRAAPAVPAASGTPAFGIMFFNGVEDPADREKYRMVIEAARFADAAGFSSVWVPERHYTKFGSLYPNPGILQAALARETSRVRLMAGSVVLPLHHPLRAAEDWSVIDNLSGGRVGLSFAPGWNPDDFAMHPERYAGRQARLFEDIETMRRLWRGETIEVKSGDGRATRVRIYPTPLQPELPAAVTAASNPRTFERAGEIGAHLLTHLLDQEIEELAEKIALYRAARARAAHDPKAGRVTLMVHTFLGEDPAAVREAIRQPYCEFLKANIHLLKGLAASRGGQIDLAALSPADLDDFVGFVFERFSKTRALFGTPDSCAPLVEKIRDAGVDEIACLLDFGPPADAVLAALPQLERLKARFPATGRPVVPVAPIPIAASAPAETPLEEILHELRWQPASPIPVGRPPPAGTWLILDDGGGSLGPEVAALLRASGSRPIFVGIGDSFAERPDGHFRVNPLVLADFQRLLAALPLDGLPLAGALHLWNLDLASASATTLHTVQAGLNVGCGALLHLAQALDLARQRARIHVVTRGAQGVADGDPVAVAQAPAWGLGRVIALEHPELWGGMIDLDFQPTGEEALRVWEEMSRADGEDQVAWRGSQRLVARLVRAEAGPAGPARFAPDATYLVTGGLGGLGRRVARWMVERGARHLVLTGLHPVPPREDWAELAHRGALEMRPRISDLLALEAAGATVRARQADVTDAARMAEVMAEIDRVGPPLRGILHLAGLPENRPVRQTVFARDQAVFGPKVTGAWILHELSARRPLDFFAAFSSIAAVWGSGGQPLYAAANHFLDALGRHRQALGLPTLVVNWGPWAEGGMVVSAADQAFLARMGVNLLRPTDAIRAFEHLLASGRPRQVVARVDWRLFREVFEARGRRPLLEGLGEAPAEAAADLTPFARELAALNPASRRSRLADCLGTEIARVLGLKAGRSLDPGRGFFELGMDSLMAIEAKNRMQALLGLPLRATVVFNYSNLDDLAGYLAERLQAPAPPVAPPPAGRLEDLSPEELIKFLDREIGARDSAGPK